MYQVNDLVVYGKNGVCMVEAIGAISISDSDKIYYTLRPAYKSEAVIYAPVEKGKIIMRSVMSRTEADTLIKQIPSIDETDDVAEKERENIYKQALISCDSYKIAKMMKVIYSRKIQRQKEGKKITVLDDKYYKLAEEQLFGELAFALDMNRSEIENYIRKEISIK